jgi:hypothetical protein
MKLLKSPKNVENCRKLRKIQSKIHWNPLRWIFAVGLTKITFMLYCLM